MSRLLRENRNWLADHDLASPAVDVSSVATDPSTSSTRKRESVIEKLDFTRMDAGELNQGHDNRVRRLGTLCMEVCPGSTCSVA